MGPLIDKAAPSAQMPVNKAIDKTVYIAVFVVFLGVDKAIDKAAANARMMVNKVFHKVVAAGPRGSCRGCCAALAIRGTQQSNRDNERERRQRTGGVVVGRHEVDMPANKRRCRNMRCGEEEDITDAMAMMEEDATGIGTVTAG